MLGEGSIGDYALASFAREGGVTTLTVDTGALKLTGKSVAFMVATPVIKAALHLTGQQISNNRIYVTPGELRLTGKPIVMTGALPLLRGALTLTGKPFAFMLTERLTQGTLTLTGKSVVGRVTLPLLPARLTLTSHPASFMTTLELTAGNLTLIGQDFPVYRIIVEPGRLSLDGQAIPLYPHLPVTPARLTLFGRDIGLTAIGGASGGPRKPKNFRPGLEPVTKVRAPDQPKKTTAVPLPPFHDNAPRIVPAPIPDEVVDPALIPTDLLGLQDQIYTAQDISDIEAFLRGIEQDEQDAADIADVLALLD